MQTSDLESPTLLSQNLLTRLLTLLIPDYLDYADGMEMAPAERRYFKGDMTRFAASIESRLDLVRQLSPFLLEDQRVEVDALHSLWQARWNEVGDWSRYYTIADPAEPSPAMRGPLQALAASVDLNYQEFVVAFKQRELAAGGKSYADIIAALPPAENETVIDNLQEEIEGL